ncbi:MAG TPA: hypothetical protein VHY19_07165 [Steroidobacteraceae bacterium]|jgi:hypothetical protein|nr:hypothetical protein [Steroidobacteraceae bacterium]
MAATSTSDPAKQRQLHLGLAAVGLGVVLVLTCQQVIAGHILPHGWRHAALLTGIAAAGACLCIGTWLLIRSQR